MADTVETLRADLDALRAEFDAFKAYALPVVDGHQPLPSELTLIRPSSDLSQASIRLQQQFEQQQPKPPSIPTPKLPPLPR